MHVGKDLQVLVSAILPESRIPRGVERYCTCLIGSRIDVIVANVIGDSRRAVRLSAEQERAAFTFACTPLSQIENHTGPKPKWKADTDVL